MLARVLLAGVLLTGVWLGMSAAGCLRGRLRQLATLGVVDDHPTRTTTRLTTVETAAVCTGVDEDRGQVVGQQRTPRW